MVKLGNAGIIRLSIGSILCLAFMFLSFLRVFLYVFGLEEFDYFPIYDIIYSLPVIILLFFLIFFTLFIKLDSTHHAFTAILILLFSYTFLIFAINFATAIDAYFFTRYYYYYYDCSYSSEASAINFFNSVLNLVLLTYYGVVIISYLMHKRSLILLYTLAGINLLFVIISFIVPYLVYFNTSVIVTTHPEHIVASVFRCAGEFLIFYEFIRYSYLKNTTPVSANQSIDIYRDYRNITTAELRSFYRV